MLLYKSFPNQFQWFEYPKKGNMLLTLAHTSVQIRSALKYFSYDTILMNHFHKYQRIIIKFYTSTYFAHGNKILNAEARTFSKITKT